mgnify:CR=1 FL=1
MGGIEADEPGLRVVFSSDRVAVVEKPSGVLSVPGKGPEKADCMASRVAAHFPRATGPLVVHRLDMETSGLMVFGLDAGAQRALSMQFEARAVRKRYVALLEGVLAQERGIVELPIRMDPENRPIQVVDFVHGKPSVTRYRVLAYETDRTRVEFEPLTGRTHQLRVHAAHEEGMRAPIVGDVLYGGGAASGDRLMLHATELSVFDPDTGRELSFTSATPF